MVKLTPSPPEGLLPSGAGLGGQLKGPITAGGVGRYHYLFEVSAAVSGDLTGQPIATHRIT